MAVSRYVLSRRQSFKPSCPLGGKWYVCKDGSKFAGCCQNEPCTLGCKQGNLKAASFDSAKYGSFPDLRCDSGLWYTCAKSNPPFMGCCESNPCRGGRGCPADDLAAGFLSDNKNTACQFYPEGCKVSKVRIIGGAAAGGAGFVIVALLLFYYYHRTRKARNRWASGLIAKDDQASVKKMNADSPEVVSSEKPDVSHHSKSYSYELPAVSPPVSELPASPESPPFSCPSSGQPRSLSYELSATSPLNSIPSGRSPPIGLGLDIAANQSQDNVRAPSPIIRRKPVSLSTSPDLSELSPSSPTTEPSNRAVTGF